MRIYLVVIFCLLFTPVVLIKSEKVSKQMHSLNDGLVAYYSFDDGTASDLSGNANNGAINGVYLPQITR